MLGTIHYISHFIGNHYFWSENLKCHTQQTNLEKIAFKVKSLEFLISKQN